MAEKENRGFSANQSIVVAFMLFLSFGLLVAMNAAQTAIRKLPVLNLFFTVPSPLPTESSPMFFAMFVTSFFFLFFIVDWINSHFNTAYALHPMFPLLFFALGLFAYYVALFWYMSNFTVLSGESQVRFDYWTKLHESAFMLFVWGGVFGWITRFVVGKIRL